MDPQVLAAGFRIAVLVTAVALLLLVFEPRGSAEFVVSAMALAIGLIFVGFVAILVRYSTPRIPRAHNAPVQRRRKEHK
jgi:protein-S-isoprenylcysteine O-methyltransferase Ste14